MRAKLLAMTQLTPAALMASGACSREEPQPKLVSATITSPGRTRWTNSASMSSMQWGASSSAVFRLR
jgi:hypothetical protein